MPFLSYVQRHGGRELGSATAVADSKQTLLCTHLSAALPAGLARNSLFRWAWADPAAALIIAGAALTKSNENWRNNDHRTPP